MMLLGLQQRALRKRNRGVSIENLFVWPISQLRAKKAGRSDRSVCTVSQREESLLFARY